MKEEPFEINNPEIFQPADRTSKIRVSAVVSTYNAEMFIHSCLEDLVSQTLYGKGALEIIVVDSGSEQNEKAIVKAFQKRYPNIHYLRTENRETIYAAWNRGIKAAKGTYITNANTDDRHRRDALEVMTQVLDHNPDVGIVYADSFITNVANESFDHNSAKRRFKWPDYNLGTLLSDTFFGPHPVWRREAHNQIEFFDPSKTIAGDYDFWIRLAWKYGAVHLHEILGLFLEKSDSISGIGNRAQSSLEAQQILRFYRERIPFIDIYPKLKDYIGDPYAMASVFMDFGNLCAMAPYSDFQLAIRMYEKASSVQELSAATTINVQKKANNNISVLLFCSGETRRAKDFLERSFDISEARFNKDLMERISSPKKNLHPFHFSMSQIEHPVVNDARRAYGLRLDDNGCMEKMPEHQQVFWDTYRIHEGVLISPEEKLRALAQRSQNWSLRSTSCRGSVHSNEIVQSKHVIADLRPVKAGKLRLLFVVHGLPDQNVGGTEIYAVNLACALQQMGHNVQILCPRYTTDRPPVFITNDIFQGLPVTCINLEPARDLITQFKNETAAGLFWQYLSNVKFDLIHFLHLMNFSASCLDTCKKKGLPVVLSAHDAWLICEQTHLICADGKFCERGPETIDKCARCFAVRNKIRLSTTIPSELLNTFELRRDFLQKSLHLSDALLVPSNFIWKTFERHGFAHTDTRFCPLGIHPFNVIPQTSQEGFLRFTFLGNIFFTKGLDIAIQAFNMIPPGKAVFNIYGRIADSAYFNRVMLQVKHQQNVTYKGAFSRQDLSIILSQTDIAVVPSRSESYSFVTRECLHAGVPVIASDVGGIPEIIQDGVNGFLFKQGDHNDLADKMRFFVENYQEVDTFRKRITPVKTVDEDASQLDKIYRDVLTKKESFPLIEARSKQKKQVEISVIVPTINNLRLTKNCLDAIRKNTGTSPYEIIVVDNGSTDGTPDFLLREQEAGRLRAILNQDNLGFAKACNRGASAAKGTYLLFLNNDTLPQPGWLEAMVQLAENDRTVGIVGAKLLFPDGTIQHAGVVISSNKLPYHIYRGLPADTPCVNKPRDFQIVTAACMLIGKELFSAVGRFDERYINGCEDIDLCLKVRQKNRRIVYTPNSVVTHLEAQSKGRQDKMDFNRWLFLSTWQDKIHRDDTYYLQQDSMELRIEPDGSFKYFSKEKIKQIITSIVIVTYNSAPTIRSCIESVLAYTPDSEVIVVDNNSADETPSFLKDYEDRITLLLNDKNKGFSFACNQGIRASAGDHVILLNPDTVVTPFWADRMLSHFRPGVGAVGPVSNYVAAMQKFELYVKEQITEPFTINELSAKLYDWNHGCGLETKLLIGFCMVLPRKILDEVGFLDEALFLGNDDLELSWRLRNHGYKLTIATDTFVYHKGQVSFSHERSDATDALIQESTDRLYAKLESYYGQGNVPTPEELWGIDWFKPSGQAFRKTSPSGNIPAVSIVILTYNQLPHTKLCLESVRKNTPEPHEIVLVDNGSTDGTVEFFRGYAAINENVKVIANASNCGFAAGNNQGMSIAKGKHVLLLNNDTIVTSGWLGRMLDVLKRHQKTGIVGPMSNNVTRPQVVEKTGYENNDGIEDFAGKWAKEHTGLSFPTSKASGFCLLIRREVIDIIGGLDEQFGSGNFEDDDFCSRAFLAGFEIRIAQDVFIHHTGRQTFEGAGIDYNTNMARNWELYKAKWDIPEDMPIESYWIPSRLPEGVSLYVPLPGEASDRAAVSECRRIQDMKQEEERKVQIQENQKEKGMTSIILLISDQRDCPRRCAERIEKYTKEPYEIIFVPPSPAYAPPKWLRRMLKDKKNYKLLQTTYTAPSHQGASLVDEVSCKGGNRESGTTPGFSAICNLGIREASGEYIVILDDIAVVTEEWLQGMIKCLNSSADTGIVCPMTVNIEGPQKVMRTNFLSITNPLSSSCTKKGGEELSPEQIDQIAVTFRKRNRYRRARIKNPHSFCLLFKADLVEKIGLFDEGFFSAEYSANDYSIRSVVEGCWNMIAGDVFVCYRGRKSPSGFGTGFPSHRITDKRLFRDKWGNLDDVRPESKKLMCANTLILSDELNQRGQKEQAVITLIEGMKSCPDDRRLCYALTEILLGQNKFSEALDVLERMPASLKKEPSSLELIGYCKERMGLDDEAAWYADEVLRSDGTSAKAWNLKGTLAFKKGFMEAAEKFFRQSLESDRGFGEAYSNLGALRWGRGERDEALEFFTQAFILSPDIPDIVTNYYTAVVHLSRLKEAEPVFREAIGIYPLHRSLKFILIDNLLQQKKFHDAMSELEEAMSIFGVDDDTLNLALKLRDIIGPVEILKAETHGGPEETCRDLTALSPNLPLSQSASISLCMIVKNEEKNIIRSLQSVKHIIDEMIVVDTGSTDRTRKIARAFGAKVYNFKWTDSFSDARNFSLSKASGQWILVLDADEVISPEDHEKLRDLIIQRPKYKEPTESNTKTKNLLSLPTLEYANPSLAYSFTTRNYVRPVSANWHPNDGKYNEETGSGWFPSGKVRLFPHDSRIRFEKPVHETVEDSLLRIGMDIRQCDIPIHHYGKLNKDEIIAKGEEYYQLGKKKLFEKGEQDTHTLYELAVQATELEKYEEALEYWRKLTNLKPGIAKAHYGMGTSSYNLGRFEEALAAFKEAVKLDPSSKDPVIMYATCELMTGHADAAVSRLEGFLKKESGQNLGLLALCAAYFCAGRKKEGTTFAGKVLDTPFELTTYLTDIARLLISVGRYDYAVSLLEAAMETGNITSETPVLLDECRIRKRKNKVEVQRTAETNTEEKAQKSRKPGKTGETLSLCMIVKDEEENIERALRSVKPVVDEMIVVDTGSADRTKNIAGDMGAKTYDFQWTGSFADARNFSIAKASGKWILVLDADEVISSLDHEALKQLLHERGGEPVAYSFVTRNYIPAMKVGYTPNDGKYAEEAGIGWIPSNKVRLFPNNMHIQFENPVHELVESSLQKHKIKVKPSNIPLHHYGKLDETREHAKYMTYYDLGKKKILQNNKPTTDAIYEQALQSLRLGKIEEALPLFQDIILEDPNNVRALYGLGTAYLNSGDYNNALSEFRKAMEANPGWTDAIVMRATCEILLGNYDVATAILEKFIKKAEGDAMSLLTLAAGYFCSGKKEKGDECAKKLLHLNFDYESQFINFAKMLISAARFEEAISLLKSLAEYNPLSHEIQGLISAYSRMKISDSPRQDKITHEKSPESVTVSLCMIVKDEEENIERALRSVRPVVDEMIVVDTGSADRTKNIAGDMGAKTYDFQWTGSFADARNFSIAKASGEWILVLDADEVISSLDHDKFTQLTGDADDPAAYSFVTRTYVAQLNTVGWVGNDGHYKNEEAGTGWFPGEKVRLFPNNSYVRFEFPLHERVEPSLIKEGIKIRKCDIPVHHYGNFANKKKKVPKAELYYELGKKKIAEQGERNFMAFYELAIQGAELGKHEETLEYLKKAIALKPDFSKAYQSMGNTYYNLRKYEEARLFYKKSLELDPGSRDTILMYATCEILTGNAVDSVSLLEGFIRTDPSYPQAMLLLAEAYFCTNNKGKGLEYANTLKEMNFDCGTLFDKFARILMSANKYNYAMLLLKSAIETNTITKETQGLLDQCEKHLPANSG